MRITLGFVAAIVISACTPAASTSNAPASGMTFFVTSVGSGNGANLGGLSGADKHCQDLAQAAGAGGHTWHAYLSNQSPVVNARDRIGAGPWRNAKGVVIASSVADLHSANNNLNKQTVLTEKGDTISGRGDPVNVHDVLTGSASDGTLASGTGDVTCSNWTSGGEGAAMLGHADRRGLNESDAMKSWNSSHLSRGCSQENLKGTGGAGLYYCFAVN